MSDLEIPPAPEFIGGAQLRDLLLEVGMSVRSFAHYMALDEREVRRMCAGDRPVDLPAARWLLAGAELLRAKLDPRSRYFARRGETR